MYTRTHLRISGLVQGIGYRYFAHQQATKLELTGFVRNLVNGEVEVEAQGERENIEQFIEHLQLGPGGAVVSNIKTEWIDPVQSENGFGMM